MAAYFLAGTHQMDCRRTMQDHLEETWNNREAAQYLFDHRPPENFWLGFSAENQEEFDKRWASMKPLAESGWFVWASLEPLLGEIILPFSYCKLAKWTVTGGESGPNARPSHPAWFRNIRDRCVALKHPFFFKQWGEWRPVDSLHAEGQQRATSARGMRWCRPLLILGDSDAGNAIMERFGKNHAGRLLDGREWSEFPEAVDGRQ
jgi:protein gp37